MYVTPWKSSGSPIWSGLHEPPFTDRIAVPFAPTARLLPTFDVTENRSAVVPDGSTSNVFGVELLSWTMVPPAPTAMKKLPAFNATPKRSFVVFDVSAMYE